MLEGPKNNYEEKSEPNSRPWQVDWKNPTWASFENSTQEKIINGKVVDVSVAQVLTAELSTEVPALCALVGIHPDGNDDQWLLTVTLLEQSGMSRDPAVATLVLLELADCDSEKVVYSRCLNWPETMDFSTKHQNPRKSVLAKVSSLILPWRAGNDDADQTTGKYAREPGLVAAVLCRQPLRKEAREEEAVEVVAAMMIGLDAAQDPGENDGMDKGPAATLAASNDLLVQERNEESDIVLADIEVPIDPLCLACVTSEGLICVYSIWSLLSNAETNSGENDDFNSGRERRVLSEEEAITAWFLGADLFERLESTWLPLSQPKTTISLSILRDARQPFINSGRTTEDGNWSNTLPSSSGADSIGWTSWNPWIEMSTLRYRTVLNRVTSIHVVSSDYPFLVLLGQGLRLLDRGVATESSRAAKSSDVKKNVTNANPGKRDDEWWKDQDEADLSASRHTQEKLAQQQKLGREERADASVIGGFITLCSMASWVESKTLFLDFVPVSATYIERWHGMQLLLCVGDERAVAIRLDAVPAPILVGMDEDLEAMFGSEGGYPTPPGQHPSILVSRYKVLPVDLPSPTSSSQSMTIGRRILCADATTTPSLLQLYTESDGALQKEMGVLAIPKFVGVSATGVIITSTQNNAVAQLPVRKIDDSAMSLLESSWGHLAQGWSLVGTVNHTYFLCWEGTTASRGVAFIQELDNAPGDVPSRCSTARVLIPSNSRNQATRDDRLSVRFKLHSERLPPEDLSTRTQTSTVDTFHRSTSVHSNADLTADDSTPLETDIEISGLSYQERSERILQNVSSWTQLEDTSENRGRLARSIPVIAVRSVVRDETSEKYGLHILKMRQVVIENGPGSPFSQVLCWLSQRRDYFTAASIALDMLKDPDTLYHLWKNAEKIDEEDEQNRLHGLLDGIIPINVLEMQERTHGSTTVSQLADMTVVCLIKGGLAMSKTLSRFLHFNKNYDPERASLMLVATAVSALSGDPESVASVMVSNGSEPSEFSIPDILWSIECLLEIAVERDYLQSTLNLLNANIPNELRCRPRFPTDDAAESSSDLELTNALVTMIISKSSSGVDLLLDLPSDRGSSTFWDSLDAGTQQSLALICVGGVYPMLCHEEIREWARRLLQGDFDERNPEALSSLRTDWLQAVVPACLLNAGCNLSDFVFDPTNPTITSFSSENSAAWVDREFDGEDGLYQLKLQIAETRVALEPSPGSSGLDHNILISALLLLKSRQAPWNANEDRCVSTQGLLDAACHLAGRPRSRSETPRFSLDATTLMQLCARYNNIRAGANLVGGKNGFVLSCCSILMVALKIPIEHAESFLLQDVVDVSLVLSKEESCVDQPQDFQPTNLHRHLLWLLDECVLSVRKFGDFEVGLNPQGRVDPVFAARSFFRAWLSITALCKRTASQWISEWLSARLGLGKQESNAHRLACAAIAQALLWPGNNEDEKSSNGDQADQRLAHLLDMDQYFLIRLAQASCGLVESIPPPVAVGLIKLSEATSPGEFPMRLASTRRLRTHIQRK
jgi:hypothetical protein